MMGTTTCQICMENRTSKPLPCGCKFCLECLQEWFKQQINAKIGINHDLPLISCPNSNCQETYFIQQLYSFEIPVKNFNEIDKLITKKSLIQDPYYRQCPSKDCSYIGFISKIPCRKSFQCEKCKYEWHEKDLKTWDIKLKDNLIKIIQFDTQELSSSIYETIMTNECMGCGIKILKNGGCPHMTCKKCGTEFCWICLQKQGRFGFHQAHICFTTFLIKISLLLILSLHFSLKSGIFFFIWSLVKFMFYYFFVYIIFSNSFIPITFLMIYHLKVVVFKDIINTRTNLIRLYMNRSKIILAAIFFGKYVVPIGIYLFYLNILLSYWGFKELLYFYIKEALFVATIFLTGRKFSLLFKRI